MNKGKKGSNIQQKNGEKSNKKICITFIAVMAGLYLMGYFVGRMTARLQKSMSFAQLFGEMKQTAVQVLPVVFIVVSILGIVIPVAAFLSCNSLYKKLQKDMDNDVLWDTLEEKLNFPMILSNVFSMALFCLFFCELYEILVMGYGKNSSAQQGVVILGMVLFVIATVVGILILKLVVDMVKKLNPEKREMFWIFSFRRCG